MAGQLTILHLSDFHFDVERRWDADPVLRDLGRKIAEDVSAGLVPDVVAFTGDIANTGRPLEYQAASEWIETRLLRALPAGFSRTRLLFVPGNHDVDRTQIDDTVESVQERLLTLKDQLRIGKVLGDPLQRDNLLRRHRAFIGFASEYGNPRAAEPWWSAVVEIRGLRVHFAGLCSSWMSSGDGDHGKLLLGRLQVHATLAEADGADLSIALIHHPWSYLAEFDATESESSIHRHCRVVLRGHLHSTDARAVTYPDKQCIELATGSVYAGSAQPNAFQWVVVEPSRHVAVHFRIWADGRWIADRNQAHGSASGVASFSLPVSQPPSPAQPAHQGSPFSGLVAELSRTFSGRRFVNQALDAWLERHDRGYFILEGEPGIGKSAWAAHVVSTRGCINHFNIEAEGIVRVEQCQRSLCSQLVERYSSASKPDASVGFADGEMLRTLLENISPVLVPGQRVLIVIDALDEAALPPPGQNILCLPKRPPKGVYFIVTTRPTLGRSLVIDGPQECFTIQPGSAENRDDVRRHIMAFLEQHPAIHQKVAAEYSECRLLASEIERRSEGNFMYLRYVLPEIERGDLAVDKLPVGLAQYYENHWDKMKSRDSRSWLEQQEPVLSVLAAALEQLSTDDVHAFAARARPTLSRSQVSAVLHEWRPFLRVIRSEADKRYYSIYHGSFRDFLRHKDDLGDIHVEASHRHIGASLQQTFDAWKGRRRGDGG